MEIFFLIILLLVMAIALASGFPVAFALPGAAIITMAVAGVCGYLVAGNSSIYFTQDGPIGWITSAITNFRSTYWDVERDTLIAIPLFIYMGLMLQKSKIAEELLITMGQLFGKIPGGLGISVILVGGLLAATTGIVGATVIAMGLISLPAMLRNNYKASLATGIITASGTLGQIIPPSIVLIIIADQLSNASDIANSLRIQEYKMFTGESTMPSQFSVTSTSAGEMFLGSLIPGLILVGLYVSYVLIYALLNPKSAPPLSIEKSFEKAFYKKVFFSLIPPLVLIIIVLGSILYGIATVNQAGAIGAIGATIMAGYKLYPDKKHTYTPATIALVSTFIILILHSFFNLNIKQTLSSYNQIGVLIASIAVTALIISIVWSFWRAFKIDNTLRDVSSETTITTTLVFIILIGAAMLTAGFRAFGGEELVREFLLSLPGGFWTQFIVVMALIFILGFFIDYLEIAIVVIPIVTPILLLDPAANITALWLGVMIGLNMQTSFLTPPFGFSLFYLRGVAPAKVKTTEIWKGAIPFIGLQLFALVVIGYLPSIANYLPARSYLTSDVSPPPTNPKLEKCIINYQFGIFAKDKSKLIQLIENNKNLDISFLPQDKKELLQNHTKLALQVFPMIDEVKNKKMKLDNFSKDYYDLHTSVRKLQRQIHFTENKIKILKDDIKIYEKTNTDAIQKITNNINDLQKEIEQIQNQIPKEWKDKYANYKKLQKDYLQSLKQYMRNTDESYLQLINLKKEIQDIKNINSIVAEIEQLNTNLFKLSKEALNEKLNTILEKTDKLNGMGSVSDVIYAATEKSKSNAIEEVRTLNNSALDLLKQDIKWREIAFQQLLPSLNKYEKEIRDTIGLRSQTNLTKEQAIYVAECNAHHEDISLHF
ncbi:SLC13 family permease [Pelagibacteraceae bacterium]|nr:SLC13 family permease [Pelagibacteraceae bacterium]